MNKLIEESINAIDTLNQDYYKSTKDENNIPFTLLYCGGYIDYLCIKFDNEVLWDNQDFDRESHEIYDEDDNYIGDEFEPIIDCVIRRFKEYQKLITKVKFKGIKKG